MTRTAYSVVAVAACALGLMNHPALSQCDPHWLPGAPFPGVNGSVYAHTLWDPDGDGPQPTMLVIGGDFNAAGDAHASRIAAWDGTHWHVFGTGMNNRVQSLGVFEGDLIAGGEFTTAGGAAAKRIARWSNSTQQWTQVGQGIDSGSVTAMIEFEGQLVIGGPFIILGIPVIQKVARLEGEQLKPMGAVSQRVDAFAIRQGILYAGGHFINEGSVLQWNQGEWQTVGGGVDDVVLALAVFQGDLIAAGHFLNAGGAPAARLARWDGAQWHAMANEFTDEVTALVVHDNALFAATRSWNPQDGPHWTLHQLTMGGWSLIGGLLKAGPIYTLASFDDHIFAGGAFRVSGQRRVRYLARMDQPNNMWIPHIGLQTADSQQGVAYPVRVGPFAEYQGELVAAVRYMNEDGSLWYTVAQWNDATETWDAFGGEINDHPAPDYDMQQALTVFDDELIIGGWFTHIGGQEVNRIARWDGTQWRALGSGIGDGMVHALLRHEKNLIAAGVFTIAGGAPAKHIARWNGETWHSLGSGIDGFECDVQALASFHGNVIAGGSFSTAGGMSISNIAQWDGATWSGVGSGVGTVSALRAYRGNLIAAGPFNSVDGEPAISVARWDGSAWHGLETAPAAGFVGFDRHLGQWRNELILGGGFTMLAGLPAKSIARWDGADWRLIDSGVTGNSFGAFATGFVDHMTAWKDTLFVGGNFAIAGQEVSAFLARAVFSTPPADLTCDGQVHLQDLINLLNTWGPCLPLPSACPADLAPAPNGDGVVNVQDLLMLLEQWSP